MRLSRIGYLRSRSRREARAAWSRRVELVLGNEMFVGGAGIGFVNSLLCQRLESGGAVWA